MKMVPSTRARRGLLRIQRRCHKETLHKSAALMEPSTPQILENSINPNYFFPWMTSHIGVSFKDTNLLSLADGLDAYYGA